jgi:hypothetical protein
MPGVGFELTIRASERAKTVHALDYSATVTSYLAVTKCCIVVVVLATYYVCVRDL